MGTTDGFMCERCYNRKSILCTRKDCPQAVTASDPLEQLAGPFGTTYNIVKEMKLKLASQQVIIDELAALLIVCKRRALLDGGGYFADKIDIAINKAQEVKGV